MTRLSSVSQDICRKRLYGTKYPTTTVMRTLHSPGMAECQDLAELLQLFKILLWMFFKIIMSYVP